MNTKQVIAFLNTLPPNVVREYATFYYNWAGADWHKGKLFSLQNNKWFKHTDFMSKCLAMHIKALGEYI